MKIWITPENELPVKIETRVTSVGSEALTVYDKFHWGTPFPDSLFSTTAPQGYVTIDLEANPSEDSLLKMLEICMEMSDESFPSKLDLVTVYSLIKKKRGINTTPVEGGISDYSDTDDETKKIGRACLPGLAFVKRLKKNNNWTYVGQNVKPGDGSAAICWWRSEETQTFRVIFGNLRIADMAEEDLPQ